MKHATIYLLLFHFIKWVVEDVYIKEHRTEKIIHRVNGHLISSQQIKTYKRENWKHWIDADSDCQNTRAEILIRYSIQTVTFKNNKLCSVLSGAWLDPYTNKIFYKASDLDIDHIVPLSHAYLAGGHDWSFELKQTFANDYNNLLVVEDNANQSKGARPPHKWMPENKSFHCNYLLKWRDIKIKYSLKESKDETYFINRFIAYNSCMLINEQSKN